MGADILPFPEANTRSVPAYPVCRPRVVLPHPDNLACMAAWDTETSGLFVDDGARTAIVSVAYRTLDAPALIQGYAFPFDQGRAESKGFAIARDKRGTPKVAVDLAEWTADVNLNRIDWDDLMRWLTKAGLSVGLCGQNVKFDLHMTRAGTRYFPGVELEQYVAYDTMLGSAILDPLEPTSLKPTAARLWGDEQVAEASEVKDALLTCKKLYGMRAADGPRYDLLPWSIVGPYAAQDAVLTLRLADLQTNRFDLSEANIGELEAMIDLTRVLYRIERRGFGPLDTDLAREWAIRFEDRIAQIERDLPFSPPTAFRAKEFYFDELGLHPWKGAEEPREVLVHRKANKDGSDRKQVIKQGTLTVEVAKRLADQDVPGAALFAEMSRLKTANQMHYRGYLELANADDHRLRTNFRQAYVKSGRLSVERFQAQAIPRRDSVRIELQGQQAPHPRDLFRVETGRTRVQLDLSQAELRVAAKMSGCTAHIDLLESGGDVHGQAATAIFGVRPGDPDWKYRRTIAKRAVFGSIFMIGAKGYQDMLWKNGGLDLPLAECRHVIESFRSLYPEYGDLHRATEQQVHADNYVTLVDGSKSWFRVNDWPSAGWSRRVQGSLALFNSAWLVEAEIATEQYDALVLSVHDSLVLDLPTAVADAVSDRLVERTAAMFTDWFGIRGGADRDFW